MVLCWVHAQLVTTMHTQQVSDLDEAKSEQQKLGKHVVNHRCR